MRRWVAIAMLAVLFVLRPASAADPQTRLLLFSQDPALIHAVSSALGPWGVVVIPSDAVAPGSAMPLAALDARTIANREHVDGVAWISTSAGGNALWIYDVHADQTVMRSLAVAPPYDEVHAASVALSLKTLLRSTEVAPTIERLGSAPASSAPTPAVLAPTAAAPPSVPAPTRSASAPRPRRDRDPSWVGQLGAGARFGASSNAVAEPRFALLVGRWFSRLSLALGATFGPSTSAQTDRYALRLSDTTVGAMARYALIDVGRFRGGVGLRVDLNIVNVWGDAGAQRVAVSDTRVDVALGGGAFGLVRLARSLSVGASVDVNALTLRQQFYVANELAIDMHPVSVDAFVWLGVDL